jgi:hypothetical protein
MRRLGALGVAGLVVVLLVVGQLVLPGIAAQRLRDRLGRSGRVLEVQVSAFPALKLLWHHADSVVVRMASYRAAPSDLPGTIDQACSRCTTPVWSSRATGSPAARRSTSPTCARRRRFSSPSRRWRPRVGG